MENLNDKIDISKEVVTLTVTLEEVQLFLNLLSQLPYNKVIEIIAKVDSQFKNHIEDLKNKYTARDFVLEANEETVDTTTKIKEIKSKK